MPRKSTAQTASYLKDAVFSANDGIITTFAVVAGAQGAGIGSKIVIILGLANLLADGLSMASGNYLGTKSESEFKETRYKLKGTKSAKQDRATKRNTLALKHSLSVLLSFITFGFIPLAPYLFKLPNTFFLSIIFVAFSLFLLGVIRSKFTKGNIFKTGMETLIIGGAAAVIAFSIGVLVEPLVS